MQKRTVLGAAIAVALAAAGVAAAAAVTHQSSAASNATAGKVTLHKTKIGNVLATSSGRTLYLFMKDKNGKSACYGQCATYWPPLMKKGALQRRQPASRQSSRHHEAQERQVTGHVQGPPAVPLQAR